MLLDNKAYGFVFLAVCFFSRNLLAEINDPTKPIFNVNEVPRVMKAPSVIEQKVISLQSIFHSSNNKVAVINGRIVKEGASFDGVLLHNVNKNFVVVRYKKKEIKIFISKKIYIDKRTGETSEK
jgi:hypothetical protein